MESEVGWQRGNPKAELPVLDSRRRRTPALTEEQIIEHIRTMTEVRDVEAQLRQVRAMQAYLHALQDGERDASKEWINPSALLFPENFADEMNSLKSNLAASGKLLEQLGRIEAAHIEQRERILNEG